MKVSYDPAKRLATLAERGLDFEDAGKVFAGRTFTKEDIRFDYGERRFQSIGFLGDLMVMVVWTPRNDGRQIISMRRCNDRERALYKEQFEEG